MCQDQEAVVEGQVSRSAKNCTETEGTRQRCDELLTTLLTVKQRAEEWRFLSRSPTTLPPGPIRARIDGFTTKIRPLSVSNHLCEHLECFRCIPGSFIMWHPCSAIDLLGLSPSEHKLTSIICTACSTPGTIRSLHNIISSSAAGIKSLLVSRSTNRHGGAIDSTLAGGACKWC